MAFVLPAPRSRRTRIALFLTVLLAAGILWGTLTPATVPLVSGTSDKMQHLLAFAALSLPLALARPRFLPHALLAFALFGGLIEVLQPLVGRSRDLGDWLADLLGIAGGAAAGLALSPVLRRAG